MTTSTIDIHPHIIASDAKRYPLAPLGGHQSDWSRTRPVIVEKLIAAMDGAGVQKAAIVQASTCYGHDNSYVADAVAAHPRRFTGVFSVDVLAPDAPERMHYWRDKGLTGLRLFTFGSTMAEQANWLDDPKSYPAWACADELGLSICLQMSAKAIPQAVSMAERFPKVRIVLDHCARPALEDGPPYAAAASLFELARYPNIFLKLTPRIFAEAHRGKATPETFFPVSLRSSALTGLPGARIIRRAKARCRHCSRRRGSRLPPCRKPTKSGFSPRPRGSSTRRWRINGTTMAKTKLFTLLGSYPNTAALKKGDVKSDLVDFDFANVKVSNTAFKPLVREAKFDVAELAIVTYLQARTYGKPYAAHSGDRARPRPAPHHRLQSGTRALESQRACRQARRRARLYADDWRLGARFSRRRLRRRYRRGALDHLRGSASRRIQGPRFRHTRRRRQDDCADAARRRTRCGNRRRHFARSAI